MLDAENLILKIKQKKKKIIYTLDDNLLDLEVYKNGRIFPSLEQKNIIRLFIKEADCVIVSTGNLKERLVKLNNNIIVIENALDETLFREQINPVQNKDKIIFGYMGTPSHEMDLLMVMPAIRAVLKKHNNVIFQILGIINNSDLLEKFKGYNIEVLDVKDNVEYPRFVTWMKNNIQWDFAIAPLSDDDFAKCKSDIKFLDYSLLGIPGIYSKVSSYISTIKHKENGLIIENEIEKWEHSLDSLIIDSGLRSRLRLNAFEYVLSNRLLKTNASKWADCIIGLTKGSTS